MNTLIDKLNSIPHLPTSVKFDSSLVLKEISNLPFKPQPFKSGFCYDIDMPMDVIYGKQNQWSSLAFYSINGDWISTPDESPEGVFKQTDAIKLCPYLDSVIQKVFGGNLMVRLEVIAPGSTAGWHSHGSDFRQPKWISVLHFPIKTPSGAKHSIVNSMDYRLSDYKKPFKQYDSEYEEGRVYVFNSHHYHNVFNYGEEPLIFIRVYVDMRDQRVYEFLHKEVNEYRGDLIPSYAEYMESFLAK